MAVAMPWTMAALGVAMDADVLVAVDVEAKGAAHTRLTC